MRQMSDLELGWVAGVIEGEGHIRDKRGDGERGGRIQLAMTDRDIVERLASVTGVGSVNRVRPGRPGYKPQWIWLVCRWADLKPLLELILPILGERKAAVTRAILSSPPRFTYGTKTHCREGHLRTPENRTADGRCRICKNDYHRRYVREWERRRRERQRHAVV